MENNLRLTLNPVLMDISNYHPGCAVVQGYKLSDYYEPRNKIVHGQYRIIIESPVVHDDVDLVKVKGKSRSIASVITLLFKCLIGEAISTSVNTIDNFTKEIIFAGDMPLSWSSNYREIEEELDKCKTITLRVEGIAEHYFVLENSPFEELIIAMEAFDNLSTPLKDLLIILNDVDIVSQSSRYMLLGKAIEIVDAIYPYKHSKNDNRINELLPELAPLFRGMTLKRLFDLSNNRKESRHYVAIKGNATPHQSMTVEELSDYYYCSNLLCINVIRKALGLEVAAIKVADRRIKVPQ